MVSLLEVDINIDTAESATFEERKLREIFMHVSSCNVSCGAHAGNHSVISGVLRLAREMRLRTGAHPSYPDTRNFGRVKQTLSDKAFEKTIRKQIEYLLRTANSEGVAVSYIKPHGALYNEIAKGTNEADRFLNGIEDYNLPVMCLAASPFEFLCRERRIPFIPEAFIDRRYSDKNKLSPRTMEGAVLANADAAAVQFIELIRNQKLKLISGQEESIRADSFCIHGDNPACLDILNLISKRMSDSNIVIRRY